MFSVLRVGGENDAFHQVVQLQPKIWAEGSGQWSTGLCECYKDLGDCCFAFCCFPVFTCKVTSAAGACPCLPLLDCISCVPPASLAMRASVRERYGIQVQPRLFLHELNASQ
ncbi:placenta-specific gene 8 protein-like [Nothobranchius furzeri]|uniref:Placenta-specific gene 8 protein-like n=1 Tax=Nothobranchius furzeri TaxID=105023 RepID=A0A9D2YZC1_NOTFU|nr:placenta-specific gene 8 protein-like [Nothobranchius furzeri]